MVTKLKKTKKLQRRVGGKRRRVSKRRVSKRVSKRVFRKRGGRRVSRSSRKRIRVINKRKNQRRSRKKLVGLKGNLDRKGL